MLIERKLSPVVQARESPSRLLSFHQHQGLSLCIGLTTHLPSIWGSRNFFWLAELEAAVSCNNAYT